MSMTDDNEDFAVGDDDPDNVEYHIDVPQFVRFARERLISIEHDDDFDGRIIADRVAARLSPTKTGELDLSKLDVQERVQLVLDEIDDDELRARVAHELLELLQLLSDVFHEAEDD